jgi:hypothetical protein
MRLRSASSSLLSSRPVCMQTCTLRRASGLSKVLLRDWVAMVVAACCHLYGPLRPKVSTRSEIPNTNLI